MPYVGTRFPKLEKINSSAVAPEGAAGKMDSYKIFAGEYSRVVGVRVKRRD
jgi:hypothetical protein